MTAEEQQRQRVVVSGQGRLGLALTTRELRLGDRLLATAPGSIAAQLVDQPPRGDRDQPCPRALRHTAGRPLHRGREQRLLDGVLTGGELAVATHEDAEHLRRQGA
jgi:hypothetical protein